MLQITRRCFQSPVVLIGLCLCLNVGSAAAQQQKYGYNECYRDHVSPYYKSVHGPALDAYNKAALGNSKTAREPTPGCKYATQTVIQGTGALRGRLCVTTREHSRRLQMCASYNGAFDEDITSHHKDCKRPVRYADHETLLSKVPGLGIPGQTCTNPLIDVGVVQQDVRFGQNLLVDGGQLQKGKRSAGKQNYLFRLSKSACTQLTDNTAGGAGHVYAPDRTLDAAARGRIADMLQETDAEMSTLETGAVATACGIAPDPVSRSACAVVTVKGLFDQTVKTIKAKGRAIAPDIRRFPTTVERRLVMTWTDGLPTVHAGTFLRVDYGRTDVPARRFLIEKCAYPAIIE